jgi:hypothetical protein
MRHNRAFGILAASRPKLLTELRREDSGVALVRVTVSADGVLTYQLNRTSCATSASAKAGIYCAPISTPKTGADRALLYATGAGGGGVPHVSVPTTDGRELLLVRRTEPNHEVALLLQLAIVTAAIATVGAGSADRWRDRM